MRISQFESEKSILKEFGSRIKQYRVSLNITQQQFAHNCGLSTATLTRIENGDDTKWSAIIKILFQFNLLDNLNVLIPESQPDYKAIFEEKSTKKRARPDKKSANRSWLWGEDEEDEN